MGSYDAGASAWSLAALVTAHETIDDRELQSKQRVLAELERLEAPWDRDADLVHLTSSAVIVGSRGVVLHRHRLLGRWMQPGGHLELGESPAEAAVREAEEETGLVVAHPPRGPCFIHVDVHRASAGHTHLDLRYLVVGGDQDPDPPPDESPDVRWCSWDEASAMADEALVGALVVARSLWTEHGERWTDGGPGSPTGRCLT